MKRIFKYLFFTVLIYTVAGFGNFSFINKYSSFSPGSVQIRNNSLPEDDTSKSSIDGPYVFYRGDGIVIKSVIYKDTGFTATEIIFLRKDKVNLSCNVDGEESFNVTLKNNLEIQPSEYPMPDKILITSDIEGNFPAFRSILEGSGVIDNKYIWTFGKGHLVLVGDFFDRGLNVTEVLWLIYKLEQEAELAGGKVHFILGNHEIMNLYDDKRYVRNKYIENAELLNEEYVNLYSDDTELGKWLRTKNVIEKIGDIVFLHAGISPELAVSNMSFDEINQYVRQNLGKRTDSTSNEAIRLANSTKVGPYWYRGLVKGDITQEEMNMIMKYANAKQMVVGHSLVPEITGFYQNSLIGIDLDHAESFEKNVMKALWIEDGSYYVIDNFGMKVKLF